MMKEVCGTRLDYGNTNVTYTCSNDTLNEMDPCVGHVCRGGVCGISPVGLMGMGLAFVSSYFYWWSQLIDRLKYKGKMICSYIPIDRSYIYSIYNFYIFLIYAFIYIFYKIDL